MDESDKEFKKKLFSNYSKNVRKIYNDKLANLKVKHEKIKLEQKKIEQMEYVESQHYGEKFQQELKSEYDKTENIIEKLAEHDLNLLFSQTFEEKVIEFKNKIESLNNIFLPKINTITNHMNKLINNKTKIENSLDLNFLNDYKNYSLCLLNNCEDRMKLFYNIIKNKYEGDHISLNNLINEYGFINKNEAKVFII